MPLSEEQWLTLADLGGDANSDREWFEMAMAEQLEALAARASTWAFGADNHLWQQHQASDFARWLRARADEVRPACNRD